MGFFDWALNKFGFGKLNRETTPAGTIEKEFGAHPAASRRMEDNVNLWWAMYTNHPPWESCDVRPLDLSRAVSRELAQHALAEFSVAVSSSPRAEYINQQVKLVTPKLSAYLEMGLCLGGVCLKPYADNGRILVDAFTTHFTPTRFDGTGKAIGGVFKSEPVRQGNDWFIKLEYHDFLTQEDGSTVYVVENRAFRSGKDGGIGARVPLETVKEWAGLSDHEEIEYLERPLFAYFKPPFANSVDPASPLGVSVYAGGVVDLIRQADEQWQQLRREYKSGKRRMLINGGVMDASQADDEIYEYGRFSDPNFFQFINPEIRDDPLYNGFQRILQRIEFNTGLAFGTISDPQSVEKTATEEIITKHRQFVTEKAIQAAFQDSLNDLIYAMNAWCDLDRLAPPGEYSVDYNWGDGVLDDPDTNRQDMAMDMQRVNNLLMSRKQFIMKWEGVDEEAALKIISEIDAVDEIVTEPEEEIE
ncbi:MAG: hypothetical protein HFF26_03080 [Oscillospiraceae bacterium]|nr:hypothetical protein [Oscillospiraceae bacterium]